MIKNAPNSKPPPFAAWSSTWQSPGCAQNIDLMNLAGFCRNCLSKWYKAAADDLEIEVSIDEAREEVCTACPTRTGRSATRKEVTPEQQAAFDKSQKP